METSKKKILRTKFLKELYEKSDGSTMSFLNLYDIGGSIGLSREDSYSIAQNLHDFDLAKIQTKDGDITITTEGILKIEESPLPQTIKTAILNNNIEANNMSFWNQLHPRVRELAEERFEMGFYSDSILNCLREINSKLKRHSIENGREERDGADLITNIFSVRNPLIVFADLQTENGRNIQLGYMKIFEGMMIGVRNPKSHENMYPDQNKTIHFLFMVSFMITKLQEVGIEI
jgi:uncharacterized protein (TIGR02391 family)